MNFSIYPYSKESAIKAGDLTEWKITHSEKLACAKAIKNEIEMTHDGTCLESDSVKRVIERFGYEYVHWVLAATVQQMSNMDGISQENKEWANQFLMAYQKDDLTDYRIDIEPYKLNSFVGSARREYENLHLFDQTHCIPNSRDMDYKDRVLLVNPIVLDDEFKSPDHQLFIADIGGFGCSPTSSGRKVMGHFMCSGHKNTYYRNEFIGIIADEHLPQWAKDTLEQRQNPGNGMEQTMSGP